MMQRQAGCGFEKDLHARFASQTMQRTGCRSKDLDWSGVALEMVGQLLGMMLDDFGLTACEHQIDQMAERRIPKLTAKDDFLLIEPQVIVLSGTGHGMMRGAMGLNKHPAGLRAAPGAPGHLGQQGKGTLGTAKVGKIEPRIGADDPDQGDPGKIMPLGHHLGAEQNIDVAALHGTDQISMGAFAAGGVPIHARDACLGKRLSKLFLQALGTGTLRLQPMPSAARTARRRTLQITAVMATQSALRLIIGQGNFAMRAVKGRPAFLTQQIRRKAAAVEQQKRLLAPLQILGQRVLQRWRQSTGKPLASEIDQVDLGQRPLHDAGSQVQIACRGAARAIKGGQRRSG